MYIHQKHFKYFLFYERLLIIIVQSKIHQLNLYTLRKWGGGMPKHIFTTQQHL